MTQDRNILILSTSVVVTVAWWWHRRRRRSLDSVEYRDGRYPIRRSQRLSVKYSDRTNGSVGSRCLRALSPPIPYLNQFLHCLGDVCHPVNNPKGHIPLCVAENKLVLDILAERLMQSAANSYSDSSVYCYNSFLGLPIAREAASYFLARHFLFPDQPLMDPFTALKHINPTHVALGAGAAALLNHLFFLLGEDGDACLIPAPYYAAFENDMSLVASIEAQPVYQTEPLNGPTDQELQRAYNAAVERGLKPKFLLINNPHNPLGIIYPAETIQRMVAWARKHKMHSIVDEIYALTTKQKTNHRFQSVIKVLHNDLGDDVHMIWAVSKDFGASGMRVGIVYSQNQTFMEGLATCSMFSGVSGPVQYLLSEILTDNQFVDSFLDESRERLNQSYNVCIRKLDEMVIPYVQAEAGLFVWADFSALLPEQTFEYEELLGKLMFEHAKVVLTPGASQRELRPGMFRICYAWVTPDVLEIALERISRLVQKIRRLDWSDLNERALSNVC